MITTGDNPAPPSAAVLTSATIPLADDPDSGALPPHWALLGLPASGIIVQAIDYGAPPPAFPTLRPPLTIRGAPILRGFEGVSRRYAFTRVSGRVHGLDVQVYVWFGRARPTEAQLARADAEVRRLRFPAR